MNWWSGASATSAPLAMIASLLLSFVLCQAIAWVYGYTHRGMTWSRNMIHSIVLVGMIVCMVMQVVGDSVARAFGLVGALAIVRFRTVVRDARDVTFLFLSLSAGIAIGANQPLLAVLGTMLVCMVAIVMHQTNFAGKFTENGVLRVRTELPAERLQQLLAEWCVSVNLLKQKSASDIEVEYSFDVQLYDINEQQALQAAIKALGPVSQVTLTMENKAEEW